MEFKSYGEIKRLTNVRMAITQKIHGTNAQVYIYPSEFKREATLDESGECVALEQVPIKYDLLVGSRNRWIYPGDDNYGFAAFVHANKEAFLALGEGKHFGEWAGPGINSGEGLTQRTFVLFDYARYEGIQLPPQTVLVPVLYEGPLDMTQIDTVMADLKTNGSKLVPGFMRPEGVVVNLNGARYKKVFDAEETAWKKSSGVKNPNPKTFIDYTHLCQPIRLEKLLSKDERYVREYPNSLPSIVKEYVADLVKEEQIVGTEDEQRAIRKGATGQIFKFIKEIMESA